MNEQDPSRRPSNGAPTLSAATVTRWLNRIFDMIAHAVTGEGRGSADIPAAGPAARPAASASAVANGMAGRATTPRRTLIGYINTGLYKVEQARRLNAMNKQYQNALGTISMTRKAIRRAPARSRNLFKGYYRVLADAKRRVKIIHEQMRHTEAHLRRYNLVALDEEIARLEHVLANAASPTSRAETEMILEARRDMLESLLLLDEKLTALGTQLGSIAVALELNHVRVIAISSRSVHTAEADLLNNRIHEVTEQLTLLEQSLRELDAG